MALMIPLVCIRVTDHGLCSNCATCLRHSEATKGSSSLKEALDSIDRRVRIQVLTTTIAGPRPLLITITVIVTLILCGCIRILIGYH